MFLEADEIRLILDALRDKYGPGYCVEPIEVGRLQAKLSIMLESKVRLTGAPREPHVAGAPRKRRP